jgi:Domain of unknown function (DUF6048)
MRRLSAIVLMAVSVLSMVVPSVAQRRVTPVNNAATRTQSKNDMTNDSLRAIERRRARSVHYHDEQGNTYMVDTVTGVEWVDSALLPAAPKMKYPLISEASVGIDIWDGVMRMFGQKYGLTGVTMQLGMHNRYFPTFEFGVGNANNTPADNNYTYHAPLRPYFKLGADYNFLYNSDPAYRFTAGVRYGFSPFSFRVDNIDISQDYWGENTTFTLGPENCTAGWLEICFGLRVKLWGPIYAGWTLRYHSILHQSKSPIGEPWYIPGFGAASSSLTGSFTFTYVLPLSKNKLVKNDEQ